MEDISDIVGSPKYGSDMTILNFATFNLILWIYG